MRKLNKKLCVEMETIEAYGYCFCTCPGCDCSAPCNQGGYSTLVSASSAIWEYNVTASGQDSANKFG